jgi:hypothetical protein
MRALRGASDSADIRGAGILDTVFLVGCPRSGTTLLQQMLDAHPDVAIAPETHFIRRFWLRRKEYGDLNEDVTFARLLSDITGIPEFGEMGLSREYFQEKAWHGTRDYPSLLNLLLTEFGSLQNASIVGEKTPNHLLYIPALKQFFPTARFIHIIRDPRAVINSWRTVPWSTGSIVGDAEVWRRYMATARRYRPAMRNHIYTVRYENLVSTPQRTLVEICDFLNLPFDRAMLTYYKKEPQTVNVTRESWKRNVTKPLAQTSIDSWRRELSTKMIAEIEAVVSPEMRKLGYYPETDCIQLALKVSKYRATRLFSALVARAKRALASPPLSVENK